MGTVLFSNFSIPPPSGLSLLEAISKMQITFKDKARADEEAQHTWEYVSILRRSATSSAKPSATP
jgi:hypothetical protein